MTRLSRVFMYLKKQTANRKQNESKATTKRHLITLLPWRRPPPPAPPFSKLSDQGPPYSPSTSALDILLFVFPFFFFATRRDSDDLPYPCFTEEGQNCFGRSLAAKQQGHSGSSRVFPPAAFPHLFPELLDLGPPGLAVHKVVVAGLPLVLTAPPAPV